jgi:hypothetical protein
MRPDPCTSAVAEDRGDAQRAYPRYFGVDHDTVWLVVEAAAPRPAG